MSLRIRTIEGVLWSAIERLGALGVQFIITIIISNILTPADYGLIGMLALFTALGSVIIDSGFGQALIQKSHISEIDLSSVFFLNVFFGFVIYIISFVFSPGISHFYNSPNLTEISRVVFTVFPINAIGIIQHTLLTKNLKFRSLAKVSLVSSLISGLIGLGMAYSSFGVWSLVMQSVLYSVVRVILLWYFSRWRPQIRFSLQSIKSIWSFSISLLGSGTLIVFFNNLYTLIIGKLFPVYQVGLYNQARRFQDLPSQTLTMIVQRVTFPVLVSIKDDLIKLRESYRKIIKFTMFLNFPILFGLIIVADNLFGILLTPNWNGAIVYFRLLCVYGAIFPLHSINVNVLKVLGKGHVIFILEVIRRILMLASILISYKYSVSLLLIAFLGSSFISVLINMRYCGLYINYKLRTQIMDLLPVFLISILSSFSMFLLSNITSIKVVNLFFQISAGLITYISISLFFKLDSMIEFTKIVRELFIKIRTL